MNETERRNKWADRIERCLSSSLTIDQWCGLNHVSRSALYAWLAKFRKEDPDRFPRRRSASSEWIELARGGIADGKAIVPAGDAVATSPAEPPLPANAAAQPICAIANGVKVLVPPGAAESDVAAVLKAAMSL